MNHARATNGFLGSNDALDQPTGVRTIVSRPPAAATAGAVVDATHVLSGSSSSSSLEPLTPLLGASPPAADAALVPLPPPTLNVSTFRSPLLVNHHAITPTVVTPATSHSAATARSNHIDATLGAVASDEQAAARQSKLLSRTSSVRQLARLANSGRLARSALHASEAQGGVAMRSMRHQPSSDDLDSDVYRQADGAEDASASGMDFIQVDEEADDGILDGDMSGNVETTDLSLPWEFRETQKSQRVCVQSSLLSFWLRIRWCVLFALVSCVPAMLLVYHPTTTDFWRAHISVIMFIIVTTGPTLGTSIAAYVDCIKVTTFVILPLTAVYALHVESHWAIWGGVYFAGVAGIVFFASSIGTLKNGLVQFTVGMMTLWMGWNEKDGVLFPAYLARDTLLGGLIGLASAVFPWPLYSFNEAKDAEHALASGIGVCLIGICETIFLPSLLRRQANMVKLKHTRSLIGADMTKLAKALPFAPYEPVSGLLVARLQSKIGLYSNLIHALDSLIAVAEYELAVDEQTGQGRSELMRVFRQSFGKRFTHVARTIDRLLYVLCSRALQPSDSEKLVHTREELHREFLRCLDKAQLCSCEIAGDDSDSPSALGNAARFPRHDNGRASLRSFPRRSLGFFNLNLAEALDCLINHKEPEVWGRCKVVASWLLLPIGLLASGWGNVMDVVRGTGGGRYRLVHATKVGIAVVGAAAVSLNIGLLDVVAPPLYVGLVAGTSTSESVRSSLDQLVGSVFGVTVSFILVSIDKSLLGLTSSFAAIGCVATFLRTSAFAGGAAFSAIFASVVMVRASVTSEDALSRIQGTVIAILGYIALSVVVLPSKPSDLLFHEYVSSFRLIQHCVLTVTSTLTLVHSPDGNSNATDAAVQVRSKLDLDSTLDRLRASVRAQGALIAATAMEPSLSSHNFPEHCARAVQAQVNEVEALMTSLVAAWEVLMRADSTSASATLMAIRPHLAGVSVESDTLLGRLALCLQPGGGGSRLAPLLVTSCVKLDKMSQALDNAEYMASLGILRSLRDRERTETGGVESRRTTPDFRPPPLLWTADGSPLEETAVATGPEWLGAVSSPDTARRLGRRGYAGVPTAVLSVVHCCATLTHALFRLTIAVTEFEFAIEATLT